MTSTASTVGIVQDALVSRIDARVADLGDIKVAGVWPGPQAKKEMLFLGETRWEDYDIASIKGGRKQRDERYEIDFELWVLAESGSPSDPSTTRDRAFDILEKAEDDLALDPNIGLGNAVQWVTIRPKSAEPRVLKGDGAKGWFYLIKGAFIAHARLY